MFNKSNKKKKSEEIEEWIEKWIAENNPYSWVLEYDHRNELGLYHVWNDGARQMAKHLQSQPPTEKQIKGILQYIYNEILPEEYLTPASIDCMIEDILNKWSDE